jgi:hypothetical protein
MHSMSKFLVICEGRYTKTFIVLLFILFALHYYFILCFALLCCVFMLLCNLIVHAWYLWTCMCYLCLYVNVLYMFLCNIYIVTVCVFVCHLFSFYPFYFYLWNINRTTAWHLYKMLKFAFKDVSTKNSEPTYWTLLFAILKIYFIYKVAGKKSRRAIYNWTMSSASQTTALPVM